MSIRRFQPVLIFGVILVLIISFIYVVTNYWPKYEEFFFELAVLGNEEKAENYYPLNNSTINIGTPMTWNIYVHNHMGSEQDVVIRGRLINSTMLISDVEGLELRPEPYFIEIPVSLSIDETVLLPFSWSVFDAELQNGTLLKGLVVNDSLINVNIKDYDGSYRLVFELWVYDETSDEYFFGWYSNDEYYSAFIYMWFKLNLHYNF